MEGQATAFISLFISLLGTFVIGLAGFVAYLVRLLIGRLDARVVQLEAQQRDVLQPLIDVIKPLPEAIRAQTKAQEGHTELLREIRLYLIQIVPGAGRLTDRGIGDAR